MTKRKILMLEQDGDDRFITEKFFSEHAIDVDMKFVANYDELSQELRSNTPSLILVSMRTAPVPIEEVISSLKESEYNHIPVVVLSGLRDEKQIRLCYERGAASVIIKPDTVQDTEKKILAFAKYWLEIVELA